MLATAIFWGVGTAFIGGSAIFTANNMDRMAPTWGHEAPTRGRLFRCHADPVRPRMEDRLDAGGPGGDAAERPDAGTDADPPPGDPPSDVEPRRPPRSWPG